MIVIAVFGRLRQSGDIVIDARDAILENVRFVIGQKPHDRFGLKTDGDIFIFLKRIIIRNGASGEETDERKDEEQPSLFHGLFLLFNRRGNAVDGKIVIGRRAGVNDVFFKSEKNWSG